jgi:long-chain acyl-CoA synthetase
MTAPRKGYPPLEADTLPKYLELGKERWGNRVFMLTKKLGIWKRFTWNQVYEQVKAFSLGLMKLGLARGETVAAAGDNEVELYWTQYAVQAAGGRLVFIYPDMTVREAKYLIEDSQSVYVVAEDQEQVDKVLEIRDELPNLRKVIYWDPRGMWHYDDPILMEFGTCQELGKAYETEYPGLFDESIARGKGADIGVLSYTSGTTGLPKGVILTHNYLLDNAFRLIMANDFRPFSRYLSYISPAWATEQFFLAAGLVRPFVYYFPEEPETVLTNIREIGAEVLCFGPRQWESLASTVQARMLDGGPIRRLIYRAGMKVGARVSAERTEGVRSGLVWHLLHPLADLVVLMPLRDNLGLRYLYYALTGGAPAAPEVFRFFHSMGIKLRNAYGSTEMGLFTQHWGDSFDVESMGKWFESHPGFGPPLEWRIDTSGELLVRGASGFSGYFAKPDATAKAVKDGGWFCTGDAVKMRENGDLVFLDRASDLRTLSTGHPFPPQFIETRLRFSPFIKDAVVLGDHMKNFVSALINIDAETVGRWAERNGIAFTTFADLSQRPEVCRIIEQELRRVNNLLDEPGWIRRFVNLPKELDPDEAELTRTRKLRRDFIETKYGELIQALYHGDESFTYEVPVKYRDGRIGVFKSSTKINTVA